LKEEEDDEKDELRLIYLYMWQKLESREMQTVGRDGSFGGLGSGWKNNIKTKLVYMGCETMD
jgi:hypothetical protein